MATTFLTPLLVLHETPTTFPEYQRHLRPSLFVIYFHLQTSPGINTARPNVLLRCSWDHHLRQAFDHFFVFAGSRRIVVFRGLGIRGTMRVTVRHSATSLITFPHKKRGAKRGSAWTLFRYSQLLHAVTGRASTSPSSDVTRLFLARLFSSDAHPIVDEYGFLILSQLTAHHGIFYVSAFMGKMIMETAANATLKTSQRKASPQKTLFVWRWASCWCARSS